jgi:hypothetical protein
MESNAHVQAGYAYIVYQMGKVGSSTIFESLCSAVDSISIYKVHYLSDQGIDRGRQFYDGLRRKVPIPHEQTTEQLRRRIWEQPRTIWKIVSLVREPIARDISAYVQMVDVLHPGLLGADGPRIDRIARAATVQFIAFDEARSYTCGWFDYEIRQVFGIDVYAEPFDHTNGYLRVRQSNVDLLVLRLEDLNRNGEQALSEFVGQRVSMVRASSRSPEKLQEAYTEDVYRQIVRRVVVSPQVCARVYDSRYARHFYTRDELLANTAKWSTPRSARESSRPDGE